MTQKNNIDFNHITSKAYETLILQNDLIFPLDIFNIKLNLDIKILSFDELAKQNSLNYEQIKDLADGSDAFKHEYNGVIIIVYDNKINSIGRKRWSIAHEYGHIVLGHKIQCAQNEIEANFFAANLLLPQCVLKELLEKRGEITKEYLQRKFSISEEASEKYLLRTNGRGFEFISNEYDDIILFKARKFLDNEIRNSKRYQLLIDDEKQEERNNWLYE